MFRAILAYLQETLHERRFGDFCAVVDVGWSRGVGRHPETKQHLLLHTLVTKPAFVYCLLKMDKHYPKHAETFNINRVK
jgi:hypothetical protein